MSDVCNWRETSEDWGIWESDCGNSFCINDGTPSENGFKFCCYCGKPLTEERLVDDFADEEDEE